MGIAEVIPGVSGGTIAFVTGIYERLIGAIKNFLSPAPIRAFREGGVKSLWQVLDGRFLSVLLLGMGIGMLGGIFSISFLLEMYPAPIWGLFFGLIFASIFYIGGKVDYWNYSSILSFIIGAAIAFSITFLHPGQGTDALWFVFFSGMIAISALILPGVSGSFILLLMGMYTIIIPSVKDAIKTLNPDSLIIVGVFAAGCLIGLGVFSRVLTWAFKKYRDQTMAILAGFMLGSLNKIWPWRNVIEYRINSKGHKVPLIEDCVLPSQYLQAPPYRLWVVLMMLTGVAIVIFLAKAEKKAKWEKEA